MAKENAGDAKPPHGFDNSQWAHCSPIRHSFPVAANLLNRHFDVAGPNQVWASDRGLSEAEVDFVVALIMGWIEGQTD